MPGTRKKTKPLRKKVKLRYQRELDEFEKTNNEGPAPARPKGHLDRCLSCKGSGLVHSAAQALADTQNYPHLAIIGGGIGGAALAVACLHRGIPFTLYERDNAFDTRSQGYGLTLQQASKAIEGLGIFSLEEGCDFKPTCGSYHRWKSDRRMGNKKFPGARAENVTKAHQCAYSQAVVAGGSA